MPERLLATVLFTDIVGSTERAAELGDRQWRELLERHHAATRRELQRFGGRELATAGDGFLATFEGPERAIRCACAIRDAVRELGIEIRGGLHAGEVEMMGGTVGGIAVHIGARVAGLAGAGEVLVSSTVHDLVAGSGFEFEDRGSHGLKGVPGEWRLYAVTGEPVRIPVPQLVSRARRARLPRVLLLYLPAGAAVMWVTLFLRDELGLPAWVVPLAVGLLGIGLVVLSATAVVQARSPTDAPAGGKQAPGSWAIDLADVGRSLARGHLPHLTWGRSLLGGAIAFSLLFGLAGLYVVIQDRGRSFSPREAVAGGAGPGIAVLPFTVRGAGLDVWREGMVDVLSTNLDGAAGLRAIDSRTVLARWRERVGDGESPDLPTALQVARQTGARYAVVGSAVATGSDVRFGAEVYEVESGARVGQGQVVSPPDSILSFADRLSIEILRAIVGGKEGDLPQVSLARVTTGSLPAMKAYMEGEVLFRRSEFEQAVAAYERAVEADSMFALAWSRLATAHGWAEGIESELADQALERAARLADRLPAREAVLVRANLALARGTLDGIVPLRQVVRRYPDDAEAWFLLGDTYWHLGYQALLGTDQAERAFAKAIELDPGFAPYYAHVIERAFHTSDRPGAARLIETYGRLAPGSASDVANRLAFALVFGDSSARAAARATVDTLQGRALHTLALGGTYVWTARMLGLAEELLAARPDLGPTAGRWLVSVQIARGKLRTALGRLEDPQLSERPEELLHAVYASGMPAASVPLEEVLQRVPADSVQGFPAFYAGAYAVDRERWSEHAAAVARLREQARRLETAADTTAARFAEGAAQAVEAYALWRKGQREAALPMLKAAQQQATGVTGAEDHLNATLRWWLGEVLIELDRAREAEVYFKSLGEDTYLPSIRAWYRLGGIYERLGRHEEAREAYETFAIGWKDADPELQPMVEEARAAAKRLTSVARE